MAFIYKYPIPQAGEPVEIKINGFCEVVHAGVDGNNSPCLWALVVPGKPEEAWTFLLVATGQEFDTKKWCHLTSFMTGPFVWHLLRPSDDWHKATA
jgi:hypothetical protein